MEERGLSGLRQGVVLVQLWSNVYHIMAEAKHSEMFMKLRSVMIYSDRILKFDILHLAWNLLHF